MQPVFVLSLYLIMKRSFFIILIFLSVLSGCRKDNTPRTSGTDTIDNTTYKTTTYYIFGFSFSQAEKISTLSDPEPDITIGNDGTLFNLILSTNNFKESFYKVGEYPDEGAAKQVFNNLTSASVLQWVAMGDSIRNNQVWIYRSGSEHYAKIRIVNTVSKDSDPIDYAECTFEWVYQPDGSLTFPGK